MRLIDCDRKVQVRFPIDEGRYVTLDDEYPVVNIRDWYVSTKKLLCGVCRLECIHRPGVRVYT